MIIQESPHFTRKYNIQNYSRAVIVLPCIEKIKNASNIEEVIETSTCESLSGGIYFTFDDICKLYFKYHPNENSVTLIDYEFKNHDL